MDHRESVIPFDDPRMLSQSESSLTKSEMVFEDYYDITEVLKI